MKLKTFDMKWLLAVAVVLTIYLVYNVISRTQDVDRLQWKFDSLRTSNQLLEKKLFEERQISDSLRKMNDSLKYKDVTKIYTEIRYNYGKEIEAATAAGIYEWIDILSE